MARLTDIAGEQTDHVLMQPVCRPVLIHQPDGRVVGRGEATHDCTCLRTGAVTHSQVRIAPRRHELVPTSWLYPAGNVALFTPNVRFTDAA